MNNDPDYKQEFFEILHANKKIHYPLFLIFFITIVISISILLFNDYYYEIHRVELMIHILAPTHLIYFTIILVTSKFSFHIKREKNTFIITKFQSFGLYSLYILSFFPIVFAQIFLHPETVKNLYIILPVLVIALVMIIQSYRNAFSPIRIEINDNYILYRTERFISSYESFKLPIRDIDNVKVNKHICKEGYGVIISTKSNDKKKKADFGSKNNDLIKKEIMKRISKM